MSDSEGSGLLPLVNRRTPVIDRIKSDKGLFGGDGPSPGDQMGEVIGRSVLGDLTDEGRGKFRDNLRDSLSAKLGVSPDDLDLDALGVDRMFDLTEEDIVSSEALEDMGLELETDAVGEDEDDDPLAPEDDEEDSS